MKLQISRLLNGYPTQLIDAQHQLNVSSSLYVECVLLAFDGRDDTLLDRTLTRLSLGGDGLNTAPLIETFTNEIKMSDLKSKLDALFNLQTGGSPSKP